MRTKINSEFYFEKQVEEGTVQLTLYIDYENRTYDFMQMNEEGIFPSKHNKSVEENKAFFELSLEILKFVEAELYLND